MQFNRYMKRFQRSIQTFVQPNLKFSYHQQTEMFLQRFIGRRKINTFNTYRYSFSRNEIIQSIQNRLRSIPKHLKNESNNILKLWAYQCECILAQRIRRSHQMFILYTKIWQEQTFSQFMRNLKLHMSRRGKELVLSAVGVGVYNWDAGRIPEDEMRCHLEEIEYIKLLKRKTIDCETCNNPDKSKIDKSIITFCECDTRKDIKTFDNWSVFIEQGDLIVWRRLHKSGAYEYKVYGNYNDVTAEDFLSVQIDTTYRKKWDPTAVELEVVERDNMPGTNSDIVYWEMQWPRLFANRDYVFKRRFLVDRVKNLVMLLSKGTSHPKYPKNSNKFRVEDYWSSMVVKPYSNIDSPGIEFSLTYFDNPGVNIPASVTAWVAYRAMPDFLTRLRAATLKYKDYCSKNKCRAIYSYQDDSDQSGIKKTSNTEERDTDEDVMLPWSERFDENFYSILNNELDAEDIEIEQIDSLDYDIHQAEHTDNVQPTGNQREDYKVTENDRVIDEVKISEEMIRSTPLASSVPGAEVILAPSPIVQNDQSYWKYLQPTYYIS